ncbi:benzoate/H(+) symporter BenE family transporter [Legionella sp. CNM-1927-20]|uniref:benzoate/H(+) symporter BenE family transporter n=1 Tax=Legionella sp. CNM-1927-20 TaxID=3422221 RepID=UPI00403A88C1
MPSNFSLSQMMTGFMSVMIGFSSTAVIILQAAAAAGTSTAELNSWIFSLCLGVACTCIGLSLYYRMPILTAWSTPGAAFLIASLPGIPLNQAIGAFIFSAVLTIFAGVSGSVTKIMRFIPTSIASAMLAGILLHFGIGLFMAVQAQSLLVLGMIFMYLLGKQFFPRVVILIVMASGMIIAAGEGLINTSALHLEIAYPIFTKPEFSWAVLASVGFPLAIVTMTSQNLPGFSVLKAAGYQPPISAITSWVGIVNLLVAPFGGFSVNLAALTAAMCANEEAHKDPALRYYSTIWAGFFYFLIALCGATLLALLAALPKELMAALAGLALLSTLGSNLKAAVEDDTHRDSALITFLVAASGVSLLGINAAFWSLLAGLISSHLPSSFAKLLNKLQHN